MRRFFVIILGAILSVILLSCATNPVTGKSQFMLISDDAEIEIGKNVRSEIEHKFCDVYKDADLNRYIDEVGKKVASFAHYRPKIVYEFKVVNSREVNAFALPGGFIYITRGLLIKLENEAQLAGVFGHEITHIAARHSASQISRAIGMSAILQGAVAYTLTKGSSSSSQNAAAVSEIGSAIMTLILVGYGREAEFEADTHGTEYIYKAGYNPYGMVEVLKILENLEKNKITGAETVLQSHPPTKDRIRNVLNEISVKYSDAQKFPYKKDNFAKHLAKFRNDYAIHECYDKAKELRHNGEYPSAINLINEAIKLNPTNADFYVERARIYLASGKNELALRDFEKAKENDPKNYDARIGLSIELYKLKRYKEANVELSSDIVMKSNDPAAYFYLAETQYALGNKIESQKNYQKVIKITNGKGEYAKKSSERLK